MIRAEVPLSETLIVTKADREKLHGYNVRTVAQLIDLFQNDDALRAIASLLGMSEEDAKSLAKQLETTFPEQWQDLPGRRSFPTGLLPD